MKQTSKARRRREVSAYPKPAALRCRRAVALATLAISLAFVPAAQAQEVVSIDPPNCRPGIHRQALGRFALHVFCDDALGTNIAVFLEVLGAPLAGKYELGKRFWQGEEWSNDVTAYAWLDDDRLLVSTSRVYGSGTVYLLDLAAQSWQVARPWQQGECVAELAAVRGDTVTLKLTACEDRRETRVEFSL